MKFAIKSTLQEVEAWHVPAYAAVLQHCTGMTPDAYVAEYVAWAEAQTAEIVSNPRYTTIRQAGLDDEIAEPGDWLVKMSGGIIFVLPNNLFKKLYGVKT